MPDRQAEECRCFQSPFRYVQGPGLTKRLPTYVSSFGSSALFILDPFFHESFPEKVRPLFDAAGMRAYFYLFDGYAGHKELDDVIAYVKTLPEIPDVYVGVGGGQTIDINKAAGATFKKHWISFVTAPSNDAPTSLHSIINNPGAMNELMFHYKSPDYVVVDTEITIECPPWMLASGIGDALSTYIEAQASYAHNNVCNSGLDDYKPTLLGMATAKLCYDVLLKYGVDAMRAAREHLRTPAYENTVEAVTLLSGLGFENTGVALAHGLQAGFSVLPKHHPHGIGVGYSTLVQLIMESDPRFPELFDFCKAIGIPVCTSELSIPAEQRDEYIQKLVDLVYDGRWQVKNVPYHYEKSTLANAIKYLDVYAKEHE